MARPKRRREQRAELRRADALRPTAPTCRPLYGQITDVDVAAESTELAKDNVLVQAGASMLSQANSSSQIALKLLQ